MQYKKGGNEMKKKTFNRRYVVNGLYVVLYFENNVCD